MRIIATVFFTALCGGTACVSAGQEAAKGRTTPVPRVSDNPPAAFTALPEFGSIDWTVKKLPWVAEGPHGGISGMPMVEREGRIYAIGGFIPAGDGTNDPQARTSRWVWRYDPAKDSWERLPDLPARREYVKALVAGDAIYVMGGGCTDKVGDYRVHADCFKLVLTRTPLVWERHSRMSVPRSHMAVASIGDRLIVAGGNEYQVDQGGYSPKTVRNLTEVFDLKAPEQGWRRCAPIPGIGRGWTNTVVWNEKLYLFGGMTWTKPDPNRPDRLIETLCYDPKADRWTALKPLPLPVSGGAAAVYANRYAIVIATDDISGRSDAKIWSDLVLVYDLEDDRWLRVTNPEPTGGVLGDPGMVCIADKVYVAGGEGPGGTHFNYFLIGKVSPKERADNPQ